MAEKKINLSISEGKSFFAHEASINYSPTQFILDFRCVTPRVDPRSNEAHLVNIQHEVVMLDPYHAKNMHKLLGEMITKHEKEFGEITQPEALKIMEKKAKAKKEEIKTTQPTYFG